MPLETVKELRDLRALGNVSAEPELPDPAIVVQMLAEGTVRVNDRRMSIVGESTMAAALKPLVRELTRTPLAPNSNLLLVKEPLRIIADAKMKFSLLQGS